MASSVSIPTSSTTSTRAAMRRLHTLLFRRWAHSCSRRDRTPPSMHPLAVVGAAREQSRGEGEVVVGGRDEPAATSFERRRPAPLPVGAVFDDRLTGDGIVALVRRRQPADALAAHAEGGVLHSERIADPLAQGIP